MSFAATRQAIEERFRDFWLARTKVHYENTAFEPTHGVAWVRLSIREGEGNQIELAANPLHKFAGLIIVQVFTPENTGTSDARLLADVAAECFRSVSFAAGASGQITCQTPSAQTIGVDDAGWFQINVVAPYTRRVNY